MECHKYPLLNSWLLIVHVLIFFSYFIVISCYCFHLLVIYIQGGQNTKSYNNLSFIYNTIQYISLFQSIIIVKATVWFLLCKQGTKSNWLLANCASKFTFEILNYRIQCQPLKLQEILVTLLESIHGLDNLTLELIIWAMGFMLNNAHIQRKLNDWHS